MNSIKFSFWLFCFFCIFSIISAGPFNYTGTVLKVVAEIQPPYVYKNDTCLNTTKAIINQTQCYYGYCIDLIRQIQGELHFNWTITLAADNGSMPKTKTAFDKWSGVIGELVKNKADVGLGAVAITDERKEVVDFTYSFDKTTDAATNVTTYYSFALQKGSNFTADFTHMVKKLENQRNLEQLKERWWNENPDFKDGKFTSASKK